MGLLERSRELGFLGPGPVEPHIEHARRFAAALARAPTGRALDLGSGGGLPGLVLVVAGQRRDWCLLDANERRTEFLAGGGRCARIWPIGSPCVRGRAEELAHDPTLRGQFDLVVARSFGTPGGHRRVRRGRSSRWAASWW